MTQGQRITEESELDVDFDESKILDKKQKNLDELSKQETYLIKNFNEGKIEEAYDGVLDFSTPEGKAEFNVLKKVISKNNWIVVPSSIFEKYTDNAITLKELEEAVAQNHEKLELEKPNFNFVEKPKVNDDFISNVEDVQADFLVNNLTKKEQPKNGVASGEAVTMKPSEILLGHDITIQKKINALNYHKERLEKTKGKVSIKSLALVGGIVAVGVFISPLSAITIPTAIAIGGFAVLKGMFSKNPDIKNYDKQIEILKEATANMVLKRTDDDTKSNVSNFIKHNKGLVNTLFDDKIEAEFARICKMRNVKLNHDIFQNAHKYANGHVVDYNRDVKKNKM